MSDTTEVRESIEYRAVLTSLAPLAWELAKALNPRRGLLRDSDLAQTALLTIHRCPEQVRSGSPEEQRAWVRTVVVRTASKMLRDLHRAKRDPSREKPLTESLPTQEPAGHQRSSADLAEKAEESVRVRAALDGLTSGQRHVISLRYWERMTLQEIADRLGCTTSSVAAKLDRGLRNLRETLGGISPTQDG